MVDEAGERDGQVAIAGAFPRHALRTRKPFALHYNKLQRFFIPKDAKIAWHSYGVTTIVIRIPSGVGLFHKTFEHFAAYYWWSTQECTVGML